MSKKPNKTQNPIKPKKPTRVGLFLKQKMGFSEPWPKHNKLLKLRQIIYRVR